MPLAMVQKRRRLLGRPLSWTIAATVYPGPVITVFPASLSPRGRRLDADPFAGIDQGQVAAHLAVHLD
jgi:hypothetical protein